MACEKMGGKALVKAVKNIENPFFIWRIVAFTAHPGDGNFYPVQA